MASSDQRRGAGTAPAFWESIAIASLLIIWKTLAEPKGMPGHVSGSDLSLA